MRQAMAMAAVVMLVGCGGMKEEDFCKQIGDLSSEFGHNCNGGSLAIWQRLNNSSSFCPEVAKGIAAGRIKYDSGSADGCIAQFKAVTCDSIGARPVLTECEKTLTGTVAVGGDCYSTNDCDAAAYCDSTAVTCPGKCAARAALGASCPQGNECAAGATCERSGTTSTYVCTAAPTQAPARAKVDESCSSAPCQTGLACGRDSVCHAVVAEGGACTAGTTSCETFTTCVNSKCTLGADVGGACTAPASGAGCQLGLYCDVASGQTAGTCALPKADGAACATYSECSSSSCNATSHVCEATDCHEK